METIKEARKLPVFRICDTDFYVDIKLGEFRQVDVPSNTISMRDIYAAENEVTEFVFDLQTKNIYQEHIDPDHIPAHVKLAVIPPLSELDPPFLVEKFNLPDISIRPKADKALRHKKGHRRKLF